MNVRLMTMAFLVLGLAGVGCSSSSSSSNPSTTGSTWSLSGSMSGLSALASIEAENKLGLLGYVKNQAITAMVQLGGKSVVGLGGDPVHSLDNACADGNYYRVLCSAWSVPPVAAYGDVACGGANGGSFTVSGLPLNTDISCAVRKSSDGTTFTPFANLELPAASTIGGGVTTINSGGDIVLAIAVGSNGEITTTVTSGNNRSDDSLSAEVSPSAITGFYNLNCPIALGAENQKMCKCFLFYDSGDPGECVTNGSHTGISDSSALSINLNVYKGMSGPSGIDFGHGEVYPANTPIYAGSVWGAHNGGSSCSSAGACASQRTGAAEGLPVDPGLTWENAAAAATLAWSTGTVSLACGSGNADVTVGAVPGPSATRANWLSWLQSVVSSYDATCATGFMGCGAADGSWSTDPFCVGNFTWNILDKAEGVNLPRVRWDFSQSQSCNGSGCTASPISASMILVEGVEFNSGGATTRYMPSPRNRFVFDQFIPNSTGNGGTMRNSSEDTRSFQCSSPPSGVTCSSAATTANAWVECRTERSLHLNFLPDGSGSFNMVFDEQTFVKAGQYKGGAVNNTDAYSVCRAYLAAEVSPQFMAKANKL